MERDPSPRALVIGIGNEYRGDDAVGLLAARRVRQFAPDGVTVLEHDDDGTRLMEAWSDASLVVVVDAAYSSAPPGTIHHFEPSVRPIAARFFRHSTHAFGLVEAIELGRTLKQLPDRLVVYAIESRNFEAGKKLSPEVAEALDTLLDELRRLLLNNQ
jgi:hydrogenase maturation protease